MYVCSLLENDVYEAKKSKPFNKKQRVITKQAEQKSQRKTISTFLWFTAMF